MAVSNNSSLGYGVDPARVRQHAKSVDDVADGVGLARDTGKSVQLGDEANGLAVALTRDTAGWSGQAAVAYRQHAQGRANALVTAAEGASALAEIVRGARTLVDPATGRAEPILRFAYDTAGHLRQVINSSGRPLRFDYDRAGRLTGWTDRNDTFYRYTYDDAGRCVAGTGTDGCLSAAFACDTAARVTTVTGSLGRTTAYHYDPRGKIVRVVDPAGHATVRSHDEYGRVVTATDPLGRTTAHAYDESGNLVRLTRPDGAASTATYNHLGQVTSLVDVDGQAWRREYDAAGRLIRATAPDGAVTGHAYDEVGHLAAVTDAAGATTRLTRDGADLPVAVVDPPGPPPASTATTPDGSSRAPTRWGR